MHYEFLHIFPDPQVGMPLARIPLTLSGGSGARKIECTMIKCML